MTRPNQHRNIAYTLVEMLVSLVVLSVVMVAMVSGSVALERSFSAVDLYSTANADQARVLDYICRDIRNALPSQSPQVIITTTPPGLQVTVAQYFDSSGNPTTPTISGTSARYGSTPTQINYTLNGTALHRTEGSRTSVILSNHIISFMPVIDNTYDSSGRTVKVALTFNSTFQAAWTVMGTTLTARVAMRN